MSSREVRELSQDTQVQYNKFYDRCRRDVELLKRGISVILTCTHRSDIEKDKLGEAGKSGITKTHSSAFEVMAFRYGRRIELEPEIINHAVSVGLAYNGTQFESA